jgi:hypothetical protein
MNKKKKGILCILFQLKGNPLFYFLMEIYALSVSQVCPQAADVVELFIYLGEPCHACQLLLTISHGADDSTYPATVDVRTGRCLDGLKLVVEVCISLSYMFLFQLYIHVCTCSLLLYEVEEIVIFTWLRG